MLVKMWRKGNCRTLLVEIKIGAATVENRIEISQRAKIRTTLWPSVSFLSISLGEKTLIWKGTCIIVFIAALYSILEYGSNLGVVYIINGILLSHKKEKNYVTCNDLDELGGHYAKSDKWKHLTNSMYYHLHMKSKKWNKLVNKTKKQTHRYREQISGYESEVGEGERRI